MTDFIRPYLYRNAIGIDIRWPFLLHGRPAVIVGAVSIARFCRVRQFEETISLGMHVFQLQTHVSCEGKPKVGLNVV